MDIMRMNTALLAVAGLLAFAAHAAAGGVDFAARRMLAGKAYQGNISCNDGHNKRQKWYGTNRSRKY